MDPHAVAPQPAGRRQFEHARKAAVIGQQQQALGVDVEPADRHQARQLGRQHVEHGLAALGVAVGGDDTGRLVEQEQPGPLDGRNRGAIDLDLILGEDIEGRRSELLPVDPHAAGSDQILGVAPGSDTRPSESLGDALARHFLSGLGRLAERSLCHLVMALAAVGAALALVALRAYRARGAVPLLKAVAAIGTIGTGRPVRAAPFALLIGLALRPGTCLEAGALGAPLAAIARPVVTLGVALRPGRRRCFRALGVRLLGTIRPIGLSGAASWRVAAARRASGWFSAAVAGRLLSIVVHVAFAPLGG